MLLNILELDDKLVKEIMVPRTDMVCAGIDSSVKDVADIITNLGAHSRIPVYRNTKDHIVGAVHAKDLLDPLLHGQDDSPVLSLIRDVSFVQEEVKLDEILSLFKREKLQIAIVQDEYGGTSGMVTLEDVLEEIVGEIPDEHDQERPEDIQKTSDGIFIVSGRVPLDEVSERCSLNLESEEVDSIGGYVAAMAGSIPREGEFFTIGNRRFTVLEADDRQIWSIKIEPNKKA